jgi:hypothetical protein
MSSNRPTRSTTDGRAYLDLQSLARYGSRRATRDIDLQARQVTNELGAVLSMIREIAGITMDDGLTYAAEAAAAHAIRQDDAYQGVRVGLVCSLVSARISLHVDVNVGDREDRHSGRARTSHDAVA